MQDTFRAAITALSFLTFIGIIFWAMSGRRSKDFEEAANLPLNEPDDARTSTAVNAQAGDLHE